MSNDIKIILIASFGALAQEFLHWYNLRTQLSINRYKKVLSSPSYWLMVIGLTVISGVFTWTWFHGDGKEHLLRDYLLIGAAFPLILKKAVAAFGANKAPKMGEKTTVLKDYFQIQPQNDSSEDDQ
jgi:hypothetical protein